MKSSIKNLACVVALAAMACTGFNSCQDDRLLTEGEGYLALSAKVGKTTPENAPGKRSMTNDELREKCILWISNSKGPVRKYKGLDNLPAENIPLLAGNYLAEAWTGDSVGASFDHQWFKGSENFVIRANETTEVTVDAKIANVGVRIEYADDIDETLQSYSITVGHRAGSLDFVGKETRRGYFMMPSFDKNLAWKLTGTTKAGEEYSKEGVIENPRPGYEYVVKVSCKQNTSQYGGGFFHIQIDENILKIESEIVISVAPIIEGTNFDISKPLTAEIGKVGDLAMQIIGCTELENVEISMPGMKAILGTPEDVVGLFKASEEILNLAKAGGIAWEYFSQEDGSLMILTIKDAFTSRLGVGDHPITITVTDKQNRTATKVINLEINSDPARVVVPDEGSIWTNRATLKAQVIKSDISAFTFKWRRAGSEAWTETPAVKAADGLTLTADISGLSPATTYEYCIFGDGEGSDKTQKFTTESELQLPNASFEEWNTSTKAYLLYAEGGQMFWDSGNHGSSTMSKNVTVPDTEIKHGGERSARLNSQFVGIGSIGKFAAGNLFIGKYLFTDGTDGILGWGRPFASRPSAVKLFVKYTPVAVTHTSTSLPSVAKGDMDQGIVYAAVTDATEDSYVCDKGKFPSEGEAYPQIVATKDKKLFNKDDEKVIAYGEKVFTEATSGEGMMEVTIPLNYKSLNKKAVYIIMVCSASRYGDYFTGGNGSTMWIDDIQLIY